MKYPRMRSFNRFCRFNQPLVIFRNWLPLLAVVMLVSVFDVQKASCQDFEQEPINYESATTDNDVSRLQARLDHDEVTLNRETHLSYLESLLKELKIPVTSQALVFSKTSLQRNRISPRTPRAIYFNDEVYVGYCHEGEVFEIAAADPSLGAVFYSLNVDQNEKPQFVRQTHQCLFCHASGNTHYVPGFFVRSVYVGQSGFPLLALGTQRIDHTSPMEKRWGGWYVTGTHGKQEHLGNLIVSDNRVREPVENAAGQNVTSLDGYFTSTDYLSPHSDLIALMVLDHQAEAHNLLTQANYQTRKALDHESKLNKELKEPADRRWDSTNSRIKNACESLVKYFLFCNEAPLNAEMRGTTSFCSDFSNRGPCDPQGRSLRDFDLQRRLFRYPCSYLIYSPSFDALPTEARNLVLRRIWDVLNGTDKSPAFNHLTHDDRSAIREILCATKSGLPDYWHDASDTTPAPPALPE